MHVNAFLSGDSHVVAFINQYPESVYVYESILIVHRPVWKHMLFVLFFLHFKMHVIIFFSH